MAEEIPDPYNLISCIGTYRRSLVWLLSSNPRLDSTTLVLELEKLVQAGVLKRAFKVFDQEYYENFNDIPLKNTKTGILILRENIRPTYWKA